ncbi:DNA repair protein RadC [Alteracholeplasma palmae J233]|uniref:DNA repair protein RadC n=2 Tax=Acholeplasma palmae TaxID=38986 RepID=U4KRD4_ALTPJ|nr:DNA repair protein RadC [Alteracholeplasma palmae J233]
MISDMPRERLEKLGASALKTEELIAILLSTGTKETNVFDLSKQILEKLLSLDELKNLTYEELLTIKGIKKAKASKIIAAVELGRRLSYIGNEHKHKLNHLEDVYKLVSYDLSNKEQEHFMVIYLNSKSEIIQKQTVFIGTINQTVIHPREIFKQAIRLNSVAIICLHNHPSGNSDPSRADIESTKNLVLASELLNISLVDHLIIGKNEYYSILEKKKYFIKNT